MNFIAVAVLTYGMPYYPVLDGSMYPHAMFNASGVGVFNLTLETASGKVYKLGEYVHTRDFGPKEFQMHMADALDTDEWKGQFMADCGRVTVFAVKGDRVVRASFKFKFTRSSAGITPIVYYVPGVPPPPSR